jgi:class IIb bacteriocin, lactobin A/cerein 7B family
MQVLKSNELEQVSGGFVANAIGAIAGAYGAGYGYLAGGGKDPSRFLGATVLGGALGHLVLLQVFDRQ